MTRHERNETVKSGYYLNPVTMSLVVVARDGERLPNERGTWRSVPAVVALALTPVLGALFLVLLPLAGFVVMIAAAGRDLVAAFSGGAGELAVAMSPGWTPGEAHLLGKSAAARRERDGVDPLDLRLAALEREIERRRRG